MKATFKVCLYTRFVGQQSLGEIALWKQTEKYDYRINEKRKCDFFFSALPAECLRLFLLDGGGGGGGRKR